MALILGNCSRVRFFRIIGITVLASIALGSSGCGYSFWPWGKRDNASVSKPRPETNEEKCARFVREVCDAAVAIRRADMLELEGAAIVAARGGGPDASANVAGRASNAALAAASAYVAGLTKLAKFPRHLADTQIDAFKYQDKNKQELLTSLKPVIRRNLNETKLGLKPSTEACVQDLQSVRYLN